MIELIGNILFMILCLWLLIEMIQAKIQGIKQKEVKRKREFIEGEREQLLATNEQLKTKVDELIDENVAIIQKNTELRLGKKIQDKEELKEMLSKRIKD